MVHLALVEQVVHVSLSQIPFQKPCEHPLQLKLLTFTLRQQLFEVPQTYHYLLQHRSHHLDKSFETCMALLTLFFEQFFVFMTQNLPYTALHYIDGDVLLVVIFRVPPFVASDTARWLFPPHFPLLLLLRLAFLAFCGRGEHHIVQWFE